MRRKLIVSKETFKELCMLMHCNSNHTGIYNCNIDTILLDINEYGDKPKMTREEAARIIHSKVYGVTNTGQAAKWVDALEALGLIKFDEPKEENPNFKIPITNHIMFESVTTNLKELNEIVSKQGYEIVKKI